MAFKIPAKLGQVADLLFETREKRLALQKDVDELQKQETALKDDLINRLPKSEANGISGKLARVSITSKDVPQVTDWDKLRKHVMKTGQFELLQKRLADSAIKEHWEAGEELPGVDHFTVVGVSINKI